jgi:hypothetical protein
VANFTVGLVFPDSKNPALRNRMAGFLLTAYFCGGSYRDRTDDIHGVNVALYQLS